MKLLSAFIVLILVCTACMGPRALMTRGHYDSIEEGMSITDVEKSYGKPYNIYSKGKETETYEYLEKIAIGARVVEQYSYYLVVAKGKVIRKYMQTSSSLPLEQMDADPLHSNY